jgi:hypothetical protein
MSTVKSIRKTKKQMTEVLHKELSRLHSVPKATSYRILKSNDARRSQKIHNQGQKRVFPNHHCDATEVAEDSNSNLATSAHHKIARHIGLADNVSETRV